MKPELEKLIRETWVYLGTKEQEVIIEELSAEDAVTYKEAMSRLEFDETYAKELGIQVY